MKYLYIIQKFSIFSTKCFYMGSFKFDPNILCFTLFAIALPIVGTYSVLLVSFKPIVSRNTIITKDYIYAN